MSLSANGRYVAYSDLVSDINDDDPEALVVWDRLSDTSQHVPMIDPLDTAWHSSFSADGRHLAYYTGSHVIVRDMMLGSSTMVAAAGDPVISADGDHLTYVSWHDDDGGADVFVWDRN